MSFLKGEQEKCAACEKRVYSAEKVVALKKSWHKQCFKCAECKKTLTLGNQVENGGKAYCEMCYQQNFGPRGFRAGSYGSMCAGNYDGKRPPVSPAQVWTSKKSINVVKKKKGSIEKEEMKDEYAFLDNPDEVFEEEAEIEKEERQERQELEQAKNLAKEEKIEEVKEEKPEETETVLFTFDAAAIESWRIKFNELIDAASNSETGKYLKDTWKSFFST